MKLTPSEQTFIDLLRKAGGSSCPPSCFRPSSEALRMIRRLERRGLIEVEQTDDGFRYSIKDWSHA